MSVETKGAFKSSVTGYDIFKYIKLSIDKDAIHDLGGDMSVNNREPGNIYFTYKGESRILFFWVTKDIIDGIDEELKILYSHILIGHWGHSVEIVNKIVSNFGGYVMEKDSEDTEYKEIAKSGDETYEKFIAKREELKHILNWNGINNGAEKNKIINFVIANKDLLLTFDWE